MMMILGDLDAWAWLLTGLSLALCAGVLILDAYYLRLKLPVRSRATWILLGTCAFFCGGGVYQTISDASDAPHKVVTGSIPTIHEIYLGHNRSLYLARVLNDSEPSRLVNFSSEALAVIKEHRTDQSYRIGYLDDPQEFYERGRQGFYFKVVDIDNPISNDSYYHFDTHHHPVRAVIYLFDVLILLMTGVAVSRLADASPDTDDDFENYRDSGSDEYGKATPITSLNLGSSETEDR